MQYISLQFGFEALKSSKNAKNTENYLARFAIMQVLELLLYQFDLKTYRARVLAPCLSLVRNSCRRVRFLNAVTYSQKFPAPLSKSEGRWEHEGSFTLARNFTAMVQFICKKSTKLRKKVSNNIVLINIYLITCGVSALFCLHSFILLCILQTAV